MLNKNSKIIFFLTFASSIFLRFYRLGQNLIFNGEMGVEYLEIKNYLVSREVPLMGPPTSHEWFHAAPISYWVFGIILKAFDFDPRAINYFMGFVGVITAVAVYYVVKRTFGERSALLAYFFAAFSPSWVILTRDSRINSFTPFLVLLFYLFLVKSIKNKGKNLFWTGFVLGVMWSFFPSPIVLVPASIVALFIYRKKLNKKYYLFGVLGALIPNIPYFFSGFRDRFNMFYQIVVWVPYRVLGFFGLYPKNTASTTIVWENFSSVYVFFRETFFTFDNSLILIGFLLLLCYVLVRTLRTWKSYRNNVEWMVLVILFSTAYLGLFIHGDPPKHYYMVMFPLPIIFVSEVMAGLYKKSLGNFILFSFCTLFVFFNLKFYFSNRWFFESQDVIRKDLIVPYPLQEKIVSSIISDAGGRGYSLSRVGPLDQFRQNLSQNYRYLLWKNGNEPKEGEKLEYEIYEDTSKLNSNEEIIFHSGGVAVARRDSVVR